MTDNAFPVDAILTFWFGQSLENAEALKQESTRWFSGGSALDREVSLRFGELLKPVAVLPADAFASPLVALAGVLVLDQFPRHIFRGEAQAFAFDAKALQLVDNALERGWDSQLHPLQTSFLYMPLQHTEHLQRQQQSVQLFSKLAETAPPPYQQFIESNLGYARQHLDIIERFGRFPHRNHALGRTSTAAETAYLNSTPSRFGQ